MHDVKLYLTDMVCRALARQAEDIGDDICITGYDGEGGIHIESAGNVGQPGSGVWMDAAGAIHYSPPPTGGFATADGAKDFHQPERTPPVELKTYRATADVTVSTTLDADSVNDAVGEALENGLTDIDSKEGPMHKIQIHRISVREDTQVPA